MPDENGPELAGDGWHFVEEKDDVPFWVSEVVPMRVGMFGDLGPGNDILKSLGAFERTFRYRGMEDVNEHCYSGEGFIGKVGAETITFSFVADGISRACTHQLVRNRIGAGYVGVTSRGEFSLCDREGFGSYVTPPTITEENLYMYDKLMEEQLRVYTQLIRNGVPSEDARFVLGQGFHTMYSFYMSYQALKTFCGVRMCYKAQWEIRLLANAMVAVMSNGGVCDEIIEGLVPHCCKMGKCPWVNVPDNGPDACPIFANGNFSKYDFREHLKPEPCLPDTPKVAEQMEKFFKGGE